MQVNLQTADRLGKVLIAANAAATSKGDTNPLETALLIQTGTEELSVIALNSTSHQLKLSVPCQVVIPGAVLIPGDHFTKIVNRLSDKRLSLRAEDNRMIVSAGPDDTHRFDLFQGEPEDFPQDVMLPPIAATVDADGLHEALKAVLVAATENEQDIIFHGAGETLSIYTSLYMTLRTRFALTELTVPFTFGIPKSALAGGRMPQWSGPVSIHVEAGKIAFSQGDEHLILRNVAAQVDVELIEQIITTEAVGRLVVGRSALKDRIHTIAVGKPTCVLKVTGKTQKNLLIQTENGLHGSRMQIPIQGEITGTTSEIKLDVALFEKALKTVDGDDVQLDFVDYTGDGETISLRIANEANPEKRQTLVTPLQ